MLDLSISIVSHNSRKDLELLMPSLKKGLRNLKAEILLIDNNSDDGSAKFIQENYPEVILTKNTKRYGYGTNHNKNLKKVKGKYVVLMNADMIVFPDSLSILVEFMDNNSDVGIASANVLYKDGTLQYLNKQYPSLLDLLLRRFVPNSSISILKKRLY
ncbi:MAG: glycosyltransferase, partial [Desulfobacteraceae bacterium]|nr:glycosyltransferase [Desulfobacteraceae bacterium]